MPGHLWNEDLVVRQARARPPAMQLLGLLELLSLSGLAIVDLRRSFQIFYNNLQLLEFLHPFL